MSQLAGLADRLILKIGRSSSSASRTTVDKSKPFLEVNVMKKGLANSQIASE